MTTWRTEFSAFLLDLLDFIEEKIGEALESEDSRRAAIGEAAGAIPVLRERLLEGALANKTRRPSSLSTMRSRRGTPPSGGKTSPKWIGRSSSGPPRTSSGSKGDSPYFAG
jgi:hypothetical protein